MSDTTPTPVPPSKLKTFLKEWGWTLIVLLVVAQQLGWITPEQSQQIKDLIPVVVAGDGQEEPAEATVEADKKPKPKPAPQGMTPEQIEKLITDIIERLKPAPRPDDEVTPTPTPVVEAPKILVCDETGKALAGANVDPGQLFRVSAVGASSDIGWQTVKSGTVRLSASTDGKEFTGYLASGQWVEFGLTDFAAKKQLSLRISCNQGPQPPPVEPVNPVDPVTPVEPSSGALSLRVLHDVTDITADTAIVLNALEAWNEVAGEGDWLFFDVSSPEREAVKLKADAGNTTVPTLVIYDKATRRKLAAIPLPKSVDDLRSTVAKYKGGA